MKKKKYKDPFKNMHTAAKGIAGVGVITVVGAGVAHHAPHGTPPLTEGFNTLSGFVPIATTAYMGKTVLDALPKQKKSKKKKGMMTY